MARFSDLSRFRVRDILLVTSLYDSFILAANGELHEVILNEFLDLNVWHTPGITHVATGGEALALAWDQARYNLVIASSHVGDMSAADLARRLREAGIDTPLVVLAYDTRDIADVPADAPIERVFLWQGDVRLVPAMVKAVEDRRNVAHDSGVLGVQTILVVEDNVRFYSSFLPTIYTELMHHAHRLMPEGVNLSHRLMRLQAQPKILLSASYEEAWRDFVDYDENILGVISDIEFPRSGQTADDAGIELARQIRERQPDVPVMLQSSRAGNRVRAREVGASFLLKGSPSLLQQLRQFLIDQLGFGDFVFRLPDGAEVARARDLRELEALLETVPSASLAYHGERNHFSNWFKARTEFDLAHELRPRKVSDFPTIEHLRRDLIGAIQRHRRRAMRGAIVDFSRGSLDPDAGFCRIGGGSLGGKARGLAFVEVLLNESRVAERFPSVHVSVPPALVIGTDVFDEFLQRADLRDVALYGGDDAELERRFVGGELPAAVARDLAAALETLRYPLAIRSSSLLEDSQYQPFAGVYETLMLPNDHPRLDVRLRQVLTAVKRVYASTFSTAAKRYFAGGPYRLEEEKMAVLLQKVVGCAHGRRFYPDYSGVARSYNFYPLPPMTADDGIAAVALGLGQTVVAGERCFRFCPRYPRHIVQFASVADTLANAQRTFYALEMGRDDSIVRGEPGRFDLAAAEDDGTLARVASTWSAENDAIYDGISRPGVRIVTFAPALKHGGVPIAELLDALLEVAARGTSAPVEIEFAVAIPPGGASVAELGFLQLRPLGRLRPSASRTLERVPREQVICDSASVLGHGTDAVTDVIVVDIHRFDRTRSHDVASELGGLNAKLMAERRSYLLIGVGRWGSADPLLGIPVAWDQICGARAIVEAGFADVRVTPSQGSHFFQNLVAGHVGYFTVNPDAGDGFIDWEWLRRQPADAETEFVQHLRFNRPITIAIDGRARTGVILKP